MDSENKYGALEFQQILLEMMKDVHRFFTDNGIEYSLSGGSLLGAVRENGFIPWDDDIDLMMDIENFNKFLSVCDASDKINGYVVSRMLWIYRIQRAEDYDGSLTGATLDIFVIDKVPKSKLKQKLKVFFIKFLQGTMRKYRNIEKYSFANRMRLRFTHFTGEPFSAETKFKMYTKASQIGKNSNSGFVSCFNGLFSELSINYDGNMMKKLELHAFEDTEFTITSGYDSYLSVLYGDYMTPPPEEERKPMHS